MKDSEGAAVQNAQVMLQGKTSTTGENGEAKFENIPAGKYPYAVTHSDYEGPKGSVEAKGNDGDAVSQTVTLQKKKGTGTPGSARTATLTIVAQNAEGPLANATVSVEGISTPQTTNTEGKAAFTHLEAGKTYNYAVTAPKHTKKEGSVKLEATGMSEMVTLKKESSGETPKDKESPATAVESKILAHVRLLCNPINEILLIAGVEAALSIEVYSLAGQRIAAQSPHGANRVEIAARRWASGLYVVRVTARDGNKTLRAVKR